MGASSGVGGLTSKKGASRRAALLAANQHGADGVTFKMKNDPRITSVGSVIRKTSIDELPQLLNVLGGTMSLVGLPFPRQVELDIDYLNHRSVVMDVSLLLRTVPAVLLTKGAY